MDHDQQIKVEQSDAILNSGVIVVHSILQTRPLPRRAMDPGRRASPRRRFRVIFAHAHCQRARANGIRTRFRPAIHGAGKSTISESGMVHGVGFRPAAAHRPGRPGQPMKKTDCRVQIGAPGSEFVSSQKAILIARIWPVCAPGRNRSCSFQLFDGLICGAHSPFQGSSIGLSKSRQYVPIDVRRPRPPPARGGVPAAPL
jgi:hypothetical protein